jgi:hypothetical protein
MIDMSRIGHKILSKNVNNKLIIFVNHRDCMNIIGEILREYNPLILNGDTNNTERQSIIRTFNNDPNYRLLIMITKMGIGINLQDKLGTNPRFMLLSPNFDILSIIQATGRTYRQDTKSNTNIRVFYSKHTPEFKVMNSLIKKSLTIKDFLDEKTSEQIKLLDSYENEVEEDNDSPEIFSNYLLDNGIITLDQIENFDNKQVTNEVQATEELKDAYIAYDAEEEAESEIEEEADTQEAEDTEEALDEDEEDDDEEEEGDEGDEEDEEGDEEDEEGDEEEEGDDDEKNCD